MSNELILNKLNCIESRLNKIEEKIDNINYKLDNDIINNCEKMGSHVDFVENIYEKVRYPLQYISNKLSGTNNNLPEITTLRNNQEDR